MVKQVSRRVSHIESALKKSFSYGTLSTYFCFIYG